RRRGAAAGPARVRPGAARPDRPPARAQPHAPRQAADRGWRWWRRDPWRNPLERTPTRLAGIGRVPAAPTRCASTASGAAQPSSGRRSGPRRTWHRDRADLAVVSIRLPRLLRACPSAGLDGAAQVASARTACQSLHADEAIRRLPPACGDNPPMRLALPFAAAMLLAACVTPRAPVAPV